jgi:hypothetical protein
MTVRTSSGTQVDEVRGGGSYLSSNDQRLHFGLGSDLDIKKIEIDWPSGLKEEFANVRGDSIYTIIEGQGIKDSVKPAGPQ